MAEAKAAKSEVVEDSTDFEDEFDKIAEAKQKGDADPVLEENAGERDGVTDAKDGDPAPAAIEAADKDPDLDPDLKKKPDADAEPDPYEGMDEATKARFVELEEEKTKLTHRLDSDSGRVSAFQRQVNTLQQENKDLKAAGPAAKPTPNQIADAMKGSDEKWDQFTEDYPEVARAIDSRLEMAGKATQESVDQTLAPVIDKQAQINTNAVQTVTQEKVDEVSKLYPGWADAVQKPDFVGWLEKQSPGIAKLAESDDTADASTLIGMYDSHLVANGQPSLKPNPDPGTGVEKKDEEAAGAGATDLAQKRAQQLEDGTTIESKNAKIDAGAEPKGDFEAAFDVFAKRKDAQRATA